MDGDMERGMEGGISDCWLGLLGLACFDLLDLGLLGSVFVIIQAVGWLLASLPSGNMICSDRVREKKRTDMNEK